MITLITGAPGAGKTSWLVKLLSELAKGRAIFVDGIPELKVPHVPLEDATRWPELVPDGAAIVIDEVQRVWRPAGPGANVSNDIAMLETHRHRGLDFFIVTQHPKLVHSNVRALVGRHIHLREMGVMGRWWYEWPEASNPETFRTAPVKKKFALDKKSFGLYRSASEHIKPIRSIPPALLIFLLCLPVIAWLSWYVYGVIQSKVAPDAFQAVKTSEAGLQGKAASPQAVVAGARAYAVTYESLTESFTPRVAAEPHTAPAYDHLRVVKVMPRIVGGYCQGEFCRCFTQQSTDAGIGQDACRRWIQSPPFDPYRAEDKDGGPVHGGDGGRSAQAGDRWWLSAAIRGRLEGRRSRSGRRPSSPHRLLMW